MDTYSSRRHKEQFIIILVTLVLVVCVLVGSVLAWLKKDYSHDSGDDNLEIGTVAVEIYADGNNVTHTTSHENGNSWSCASPYSIPTGSTSRRLSLKIRNTGTVDILVRATIRVYSVDSNNNIVYLLGSPEVLTTGAVKINMNTSGWYQSLGADNGVATGDLYLNERLEPYVLNGESSKTREIPIITDITVPTGYESKQILVSVTVDAVAYSGNIYKKIYENNPSNVTTVTREGDSRKYSEFTVPDSYIKDLYPNGETNLIPVPAFPFGSTIPCDLSGSENTGWLGWL